MQEFTRKYKLPLLLILVMFLGNIELIYAHHPHDAIDTLELSPSYEQDQMLYITRSGHIRKSTDGGASWKELVNGLDNKHNLSDIAISPSFHVDQTLFISSDGDGIYKSRDKGASWVKVNNGLKNLKIRSLSIYPNYASEHVVLAAGSNRGLYRTDNGGESWEQVIAENIKITAIAFLNVEENKQVLAGDQHGNFYISYNDGENWQQYSQLLGSGAVTAIAVSPNISVDDILFIGTEKQGIFKTTDRGVSFEKAKELHKPIISLVISNDYATDSTIFASTWDEAVYISKNGGKTWKQYDAGLTTDKQADSEKYRSPHFRDVKLSNTFGRDKVLFLGGFDGLFKSTDAGHSWSQLETMPVRLIKGLGVSPRNGDEFLIGLATYGGGGYVTADRGRTWRISNVGLHKTRLSDVVFSPNYHSDHKLFSGAYGVLLQSTDGGNTWNRIQLRHKSWRTRLSSGLRRLGLRRLSGRVLTPAERRRLYPTRIALSPNFAVDNALYFGTRWHGIYKTVDGGQTSVPLWDSSGKAVTALVISPDFPSDKTLFASILGHGIYKTVDGGETWEAVNDGLTSTNNQGPGFVNQITKKKITLTISPHYKTDQTVFAGFSEGLYKTRDGGKSWLKIDNPIYGRNAYIIGVGISPNYENDQTLLISTKGRGLFKSEDGATTFVHIAPDLIEANHAIELFAFSSSYSSDNTIYAASDEEMFRSSDGGNTWKMIARPVRYENMREPIHYKGAWELQEGEDFSASSINYSEVAGDQAMLSFVGSGVTWIGTKSPNQGIARVYIDGEHQGDVDQFSDTGETLVEAYSISGLTYGPHSIRVEITNDKNPKSTGYRIEIDAFDVKPGIEQGHKE